MSTFSSFPLKLNEIFFITLEFNRRPSQPKEAQIQINSQIKILQKNEQDKLQVNFRIHSEENLFFKVNMELVALFDYLDPSAELNQDRITDFINSQVFLLAWTHCSSFLSQISSTMGISPLHLAIPDDFMISKDQLFLNPKKQSSGEDTINE